jgi:hypothetical protein
MGVNVKGVWLGMKYQVRQMLKNGGGSIVNNSSSLGVVGLAGAPIYIASKHAVIGLTKAAALTYAKAGVRINAICPGGIEETDMFNAGIASNEQLRQAMLAMHPVGRFGKPAEIASAVIWLCSEGAGFVTGHSLRVDGGVHGLLMPRELLLLGTPRRGQFHFEAGRASRSRSTRFCWGVVSARRSHRPTHRPAPPSRGPKVCTRPVIVSGGE